MRVSRRKITPHISRLIGGFFAALAMLSYPIILRVTLQVDRLKTVIKLGSEVQGSAVETFER